MCVCVCVCVRMCVCVCVCARAYTLDPHSLGTTTLHGACAYVCRDKLELGCSLHLDDQIVWINQPDGVSMYVNANCPPFSFLFLFFFSPSLFAHEFVASLARPLQFSPQKIIFEMLH